MKDTARRLRWHRAWLAPSGSNPFQLLQVPPDAGLGGDFTPRPSDWQKYPVQRGPKDYWFGGQYRDPAGGAWQRTRWLNKLEVDPGLVARAEQELPRYCEGRVLPEVHLAE